MNTIYTNSLQNKFLSSPASTCKVTCTKKHNFSQAGRQPSIQLKHNVHEIRGPRSDEI